MSKKKKPPSRRWGSPGGAKIKKADTENPTKATPFCQAKAVAWQQVDALRPLQLPFVRKTLDLYAPRVESPGTLLNLLLVDLLTEYRRRPGDWRLWESIAIIRGKPWHWRRIAADHFYDAKTKKTLRGIR